jgi:hypothetical protein
MIKANTYRPAFYSEGLNNVIFNYCQQIIIELEKQVNKEKLFHYIKDIRYTDFDYKFDEFHLDLELKNKLEKLKGSKYDHKYNIVNTGIEFKKDNQWKMDDKISYQIFKTQKQLLKIKTETIALLDQKDIHFKTNEDHTMIYIYNDFNDCIGLCMCEKFNLDELTEYTTWEK